MGRIETFGPTAERLSKAQGDFVVGDDKQGTKVYHFLDTPLARFYKRLGAEDKSDAATDQIRHEFVALMKYRDHWYYSGLEARVGGIDMDRVQTSAGALSGGERQAHHMHVYKKAVAMLGMWPSHVVEHIVCLDRPISQCSAFGIAISPHIFRKMLRDAARKLVEFWKIA